MKSNARLYERVFDALRDEITNGFANRVDPNRDSDRFALGGLKTASVFHVECYQVELGPAALQGDMTKDLNLVALVKGLSGFLGDARRLDVDVCYLSAEGEHGLAHTGTPSMVQLCVSSTCSA